MVGKGITHDLVCIILHPYRRFIVSWTGCHFTLRSERISLPTRTYLHCYLKEACTYFQSLDLPEMFAYYIQTVLLVTTIGSSAFPQPVSGSQRCKSVQLDPTFLSLFLSASLRSSSAIHTLQCVAKPAILVTY